MAMSELRTAARPMSGRARAVARRRRRRTWMMTLPGVTRRTGGGGLLDRVRRVREVDVDDGAAAGGDQPVRPGGSRGCRLDRAGDVLPRDARLDKHDDRHGGVGDHVGAERRHGGSTCCPSGPSSVKAVALTRSRSHPRDPLRRRGELDVLRDLRRCHRRHGHSASAATARPATVSSETTALRAWPPLNIRALACR